MSVELSVVSASAASGGRSAAKRARLIAAARLYLMRRPDAGCRFDVFLVEGPPRHVQWIRNAFGE